jgi:hypothetical protein
MYKNNTSGMVKRSLLEEFIVSGNITKFFRSTGWVTISDEPIRQADLGNLIERRVMVTW